MGGKGSSANPSSCSRSTSRWSARDSNFSITRRWFFVSALTGERTEKLYWLIDKVAEARRRRISTGELNRWLAGVDLDRGTSPASRKVKIYYVTQAATAPPTFVLFTNQTKPLHFSYQRFLTNRLRAAFDFIGTPIRFTQRLKKTARRTIEEREAHRGEKRAPRYSRKAGEREISQRKRPQRQAQPRQTQSRAEAQPARSAAGASSRRAAQPAGRA